MATKLQAVMSKRLKAIGIIAKTEEDAHTKLLDKLNNELKIEGMDDEELDMLVDIVESISDPVDITDDDTTSEEDDYDELASEVEIEEAEEEEEAETPTDAFDALNRTELKKFIKGEGLEITVMKSWSDDDIRTKIREYIASGENTTTAVVQQPTVPKEDVKPTRQKKSARPGKLTPLTDESHRVPFAVFEQLFPTSEYEYRWLVTGGVTIKKMGANGTRAMISIERCHYNKEGDILCLLVLWIMKKHVSVLEDKDIEYTFSSNGNPTINKVTFQEVVEICGQLKDIMTDNVEKIDAKLGKNYEKMQKGLTGNKK